ncbi:MAG: cobalamin-dependent protein [Rhodospirillales bacterium]
MNDIKIGLVQINNSFSGQNYLPYSVACLQSYAMARAQRPERYHFLPPIYKRIPIRDAVSHVKDADVVGFSSYVWNAQISLETARRIKEQRPETLIVFGGPQVPDQPEAFLTENPFIDIVVLNEGEKIFLQILEGYPERNWPELPSVSFFDQDRNFVRNPNGSRMRDLEELPSPFLNGIFDTLLKQNPSEHWIGLWETNRGCPFQCTFCDWGSATAAKLNKFENDRLFQEIDWFAKNRVEYIFCCDANFGILKRDIEIAEYVAKAKEKTGFPQALSVQNTKNATERAYSTQKILSDSGLNKGVALSMQSVDSHTLENIKRQNISLETYLELQRRFTRDKVETYSDLILALPGETYDSFTNGVNTLIETGQHNRIQFNNLSILPNAEMGDPEYIKKFGITTIKSEIINIHGSREELDDDVPEIQDLVVATHSMPLEDWRRTRAFCWMTAFLHFDKILQMPLIVVHELSGISYRNLIESFLDVDRGLYPVIADIRDFFLKEAANIQNGGAEYVYSEKYLGIYWPADEYVFIKLTAENKFQEFYAEAKKLMHALIQERNVNIPFSAVDDAIKLNGALVKQPFVGDDTRIETEYNIAEFWRSIREGGNVPLQPVHTTVEINRSAAYYENFNRWCREVVWWGNKKGAYLYGNQTVERQLAGHY